jgi:hypothetical protein
MENTTINFKKERDFGEVFGASVSFIQQEIKRLGTAILYFVVPFMLVAAILTVLISVAQQNALGGIATDPYGANPFENLGLFYFYIFLTVLVYAFAMTALQATFYGYMKLYIQKGKDGFELKEVGRQVAKYFFPILGASIVTAIIMIIGFILCIIPGIYFAVSLSLIYSALIFEGKGFGNAFSRSFELTKQNWWLTLGLVIVATLIVYVLSIILSIPSILLGLKPMLTNIKDFDAAMGMNFSVGYYIANAITTMLTYLLSGFPVIILGFHYFSMVEKKERPSLLQKIESINKDE